MSPKGLLGRQVLLRVAGNRSKGGAAKAGHSGKGPFQGAAAGSWQRILPAGTSEGVQCDPPKGQVPQDSLALGG